MSRHDQRVPLVLDQMPAATFAAATSFLGDVLRECQLVLISAQQGSAIDPTLVELAARLVPDLEEIGDAFDDSTVTPNEDGTVRLVGSLSLGQAPTVVHLQMQLSQLRLVALGGDLLLEEGEGVQEILEWLWDELRSQMQGRPPRPHRLAP